jgi:hypothetical protein
MRVRSAMDELFDRTKGIYETRTPEPIFFPSTSPCLIPQVDVFVPEG